MQCMCSGKARAWRAAGRLRGRTSAASGAPTHTHTRTRAASAALQAVLKHFPTALSVDDYMSRVEIALAGYGFTGDNAIAMSNLCRDEVRRAGGRRAAGAACAARAASFASMAP